MVDMLQWLVALSVGVLLMMPNVGSCVVYAWFMREMHGRWHRSHVLSPCTVRGMAMHSQGLLSPFPPLPSLPLSSFCPPPPPLVPSPPPLIVSCIGSLIAPCTGSPESFILIPYISIPHPGMPPLLLLVVHFRCHSALACAKADREAQPVRAVQGRVGGERLVRSCLGHLRHRSLGRGGDGGSADQKKNLTSFIYYSTICSYIYGPDLDGG